MLCFQAADDSATAAASSLRKPPLKSFSVGSCAARAEARRRWWRSVRGKARNPRHSSHAWRRKNNAKSRPAAATLPKANVYMDPDSPAEDKGFCCAAKFEDLTKEVVKPESETMW